MRCGAHIMLSPTSVGDLLCAAVARGHITRLKSFFLAGVDLNQPDISNRTALQVATQHNQNDCKAFLLSVAKQRAVTADLSENLDRHALDVGVQSLTVAPDQ